MNELAPLTPTNMDEAIRLAKAMSDAKMVPKHLQGDVGTCLMIVEQAMRWRMSPFAVAQCTSNIGGKLMYEGKVTAAAVESQGAIEGHFDYDLAGEGDDRQVTVSARRRGEAKDRQLTIKLRDVRTDNSHWKRQPDQMLCYSGVRNWARRFTPAALLGVYSPEEFSRDGRPVDTFDGPTIEVEPDARDAINATIPLTKQVPLTKAAAAGMSRAPKVTEKPEASERTEDQWKAWVVKLRLACAVVYSQKALAEIGDRGSVGEALAKGPPWVQRDIDEILADNGRRIAELAPDETPVDDDPFAPGLEIVGADKLAG